MSSKREYRLSYYPTWGAKRRLAAINFLGGKCIRCGYLDVRALQIDHIDGGGGKLRKGKGIRSRTSYYKDIVDGIDIEKYQLLCANCNWIKRYENRENVTEKVAALFKTA